MRRFSVIVAFAASALTTVTGQTQDTPRNDLPQPYRTTRNWGELPPGVVRMIVRPHHPELPLTLVAAVLARTDACEREPGEPLHMFLG